jgi:hypothetical protein
VPSKRMADMEQKTSGELQEHMLWTYYGLRVGLAAIGFALPVVVLVVGGLLHNKWFEPSISQYYHTPAAVAFFTTRDLFVGALFAAGGCLYLYKGFSNKENVALNLAAVFAAFVALLPTARPTDERTVISVLHASSAVSFFLCIAYVSLFRSRDTLALLAPDRRPRYARLYLVSGVAMVVSPVAAVLVSFTLESVARSGTTIFWVEAFGVWTFSAYWTIKTLEMRESAAEKRGLDAELERAAVPVVDVDAVASGKPVATATMAVERIVPAAR